MLLAVNMQWMVESQTSSFIQINSNMERKIINDLPEYPVSKNYDTVKATLNNLIERISALEKDKAMPNKESYLHTFKEMSWSLGKCTPHWPAEVEETIGRLKSELGSFENVIISQADKKKSSFPLLCGGGSNGKATGQTLQPIFKRIMGYQQCFSIIGSYQDRKIKEDLVYNVMDIIEKNNYMERSQSRVSQKSIKQDSIKFGLKEENKNTMCQYCQLMASVSVCPNGYIAKKLLKQLNDVEWIAGILYEDGKIVDKNLTKAIQFYETGRRKKNPEAIYRLGLLNERGEYSKPFQYLEMWQEAAKMGHLESMTDLGYLYENGLEDQGRTIIEPNSDKAFAYYTKAVEKNFPRALNNLASFYYNDEKYKNKEKCMEYFERAAEAEYVKSLYNLGIIYLQGQIGFNDPEKAKRLIKRSAQKGDIQGKQQYVEIMLNQISRCSADDLDQINAYCRQIISEEEDNPYAYYFLGLMYEGGYGVPQQPKTAILYYTKATRYDCPEGSLKLGECFRNGFGVEQNSKDAIRNFQKAADALPEANIYIGEMYEKGYHDLKQNFELAYNHYSYACSHDIPEAFTHIGHMYKNGRHVKKDEAKAEHYFSKGNSHSKKNFGKMSASSDLIQSSYFRGKK